MLILLVPFRRSLVEEHAPLISPPKLDESDFPNVLPQPTRILGVVFAPETRVREMLHQIVQIRALQRRSMHRQKWRARMLGKLHKILPAIRVVRAVPHDGLHLILRRVAVEAAHAVPFNEGDHVIFEDRKIVYHGSCWTLCRIVRLSSGKCRSAKWMRCGRARLRVLTWNVCSALL